MPGSDLGHDLVGEFGVAWAVGDETRQQPRIPGITPLTTPTGDFYRVDTALVVPRVGATAWRLRIHGKGVTRERTLSFADLLGMPLISGTSR